MTFLEKYRRPTPARGRLKEEVIRDLRHNIKDESDAVGIYTALAKKLDELGLGRDASKVRMIALDEGMHRTELKETLEKLERR